MYLSATSKGEYWNAADLLVEVVLPCESGTKQWDNTTVTCCTCFWSQSECPRSCNKVDQEVSIFEVPFEHEGSVGARRARYAHGSGCLGALGFHILEDNRVELDIIADVEVVQVAVIGRVVRVDRCVLVAAIVPDGIPAKVKEGRGPGMESDVRAGSADHCPPFPG